LDASTPKSVLGRAFQLLFAFEPGEVGIGAAEMARRTGLPRATAHRLAATLHEVGVLERTTAQFSIGLRLFELGQRAPRQLVLREAAVPFMQDLYETTHETIHLAILDFADVVYLEKICGHQPARTPTRVGGRMPAHCTALGKAMLAHAKHQMVERVLRAPLTPKTPYTIVVPSVLREQLTQVRERGFAFDREEAALGVACVAAPITDVSGDVVAALSVSGPTTRFEPERYALAVRTAGLGLARTLHNHQACIQRIASSAAAEVS
jgi:DNA-binding IclR family transcriptional regulator